MIKIIISVIIGNFIYIILKKGIKLGYELYKIKKNKNNLQQIISQAEKIFPYDKDFWGDK